MFVVVFLVFYLLTINCNRIITTLGLKGIITLLPYPPDQIVYLQCCVFQPAIDCSASRSLVKINFLMQKQLFPSLMEENKEKRKQSRTEKVVLASKKLFRPANDVRSTPSLVKIHNTFILTLQSLYATFIFINL